MCDNLNIRNSITYSAAKFLNGSFTLEESNAKADEDETEVIIIATTVSVGVVVILGGVFFTLWHFGYFKKSIDIATARDSTAPEATGIENKIEIVEGQDFK